MEKPIPFEHALENTGFGKFNIALIITCGACLFISNTDAYGIAYLLPAAQCDLNLTTYDKGILSSIGFIGFISSSHFWGFISDTRGRKNVIIFTLLVAFFCTVLSSFAVNFWMITIFRYFSGFFIAGSATVVYVYLGEFTTPQYRTVTITCASLFIAFAIILLPAMAWLVIPQNWSLNIWGLLEYKPWRAFLVLCSAPSIFVAITFAFLPESPKFLLLKNKREEALSVLKIIYTYNTGKKMHEFPIYALADEEDEKNENTHCNSHILRTIWEQTIPLFYKKHILHTFISCWLQFGVFFISSGLLLWYPQIVNQLAENSRLNPQISITVCEAIASTMNRNQTDENNCSDGVDESVFEQNLMIGGSYVVGFIFIAAVVNWVGKRNLLLAFLLLSAVSGLGLCWVSNRLLIDILFVGLLVFSGLCSCVLNASVVDFFPTYIRAMAISIALMMGRIGSVLASSTFGLLMEFNCLAAFGIMCALLLVCTGLSLYLPKEQKFIQTAKTYRNETC